MCMCVCIMTWTHNMDTHAHAMDTSCSHIFAVCDSVMMPCGHVYTLWHSHMMQMHMQTHCTAVSWHVMQLCHNALAATSQCITLLCHDVSHGCVTTHHDTATLYYFQHSQRPVKTGLNQSSCGFCDMLSTSRPLYCIVTTVGGYGWIIEIQLGTI